MENSSARRRGGAATGASSPAVDLASPLLWILIRPPRRACAAVDLTGRHRADPTRRTDVRVLPRRSGHEICFLI